MNLKKLFTLSLLTLSVCATSSAFAVNSATSGAIAVGLTLDGSCTIDASLTSGALGTAVTGLAQTLTKNTSVSVNCTNTIPFKLGVTGGDHYTDSRHLSDGVHTDIAYTVKENTSGVAFGDADIISFDSGYVPTSLENAYAGTGTGSAQTINVDFVAPIPFGQGGGVYSDSVAFVVAWP